MSHVLENSNNKPHKPTHWYGNGTLPFTAFGAAQVIRQILLQINNLFKAEEKTKCRSRIDSCPLFSKLILNLLQ